MSTPRIACSEMSLIITNHTLNQTRAMELFVSDPEPLSPGPDPIKLFLASIEATLKFQPIREPQTGHVTALIG